MAKPGKLRAEHFVPANGAFTTDEGNVVIAFTEQILNRAPKATGDHMITHYSFAADGVERASSKETRVACSHSKAA